MRRRERKKKKKKKRERRRRRRTKISLSRADCSLFLSLLPLPVAAAAAGRLGWRESDRALSCSGRPCGDCGRGRGRKGGCDREGKLAGKSKVPRTFFFFSSFSLLFSFSFLSLLSLQCANAMPLHLYALLSSKATAGAFCSVFVCLLSFVHVSHFLYLSLSLSLPPSHTHTHSLSLSL